MLFSFNNNKKKKKFTSVGYNRAQAINDNDTHNTSSYRYIKQRG